MTNICNYPDCDGGPATGYCHGDCRSQNAQVSTTPAWQHAGNPNLKPSFVIVEKHDYEGGDPSLDIEERTDGLFDLVIYKGKDNLTVHAVSRESIVAGFRAAIALISIPPVSEQS